MSLQQPTITDIKDLIIQGVESSFNQTLKLLPKSFIRVLAVVLAGIYIQLFKYGGFIFLQIFVSTASFRETTIFGNTLTPLIEWGRLLGVGDPTPAVQTELTIEVDVELLGEDLTVGTQFISTINGVIYITTETINLDTNPKQISVLASTPGSIGNLSPGDILQTVNPIAQIARDAEIISVDIAGIDSESEENYRLRVIQRKQVPPQGGALADYRAWANEVAGVVNSYPYTGDAGEVLVYVEGDKAIYPPDGIPDSTKLLEVAASIDQATRRPVTAIIDPDGDSTYDNILPITRRAFDVTVNGLSVQNPSSVQDQIETELILYLFDREPFIEGLSVAPRKDIVSLNTIIGIISNVVTANNGTFTSVSVATGGAPVADFVLGPGETAKLGVLTFA